MTRRRTLSLTQPLLANSCVGQGCENDPATGRPGGPCAGAQCANECRGTDCGWICKKPSCPDSIDLLSAPMSFVATVVGPGGALVEHASNASGAAIGTIKHVPSNTARVEAEFPWSAGPLRATTQALFDYDGCVKMTVELAPTTVPLRSLQLRIPLRMTPTEATLTHTVTDYTRIHFAGSIPKGEGEVYNTTKVHRYQLPPP